MRPNFNIAEPPGEDGFSYRILSQEGRILLTSFFMLDPISSCQDSISGISLFGIEEMKRKYSPPSLQRLCNSGQSSILRDWRNGSRWRRPCGNSTIPGHVCISNRSREVRPSIPSGSSFRPAHLFKERHLSLARSPRFDGSATKRLHS